PAMNPHLRLLVLLAAAALCQGKRPTGELRCRCVRTVSEVIPPRRLARLEFLVEGPHCAVPEVIATTKQGLMVCLNPTAPWVKLLVTRILQSCLALNTSVPVQDYMGIKPGSTKNVLLNLFFLLQLTSL
uniref:C-X-C motif chemokine n=1 Tax=Corvus moneduloides TaxID=1196302 RepID=A0A8C3D7R6_CORMO